MTGVVLSLLIVSGGLWHYDLTIAEEYLEALYADPESGRLYPAQVSCPSGRSGCMAGFRGATSIFLPKKSWRLDLFDPGLIGRTRINLDAHYRDLSMMRNHLSMELIRRMGYPAPLTRHVTLSINGTYMGVYLETERIDSDFYRRSSLPGGVPFQAVEGAARFARYLSGHPPEDGFEARTSHRYMIPELLRLIGDVCSDQPFESRFDTGMFLGNMAANLARVETDSPGKNYFVHLGFDGMWRYFPWDHDASFGNDWRGEFSSGLLETVFLPGIMKQGPFVRLMTESGHRDYFRARLQDAAHIMSTDLVAVLDSVRNAIRADVYADPLRRGTPEDFEVDCDSLRWFITERAEIVPGLYRHYRPPESVSISVSPPWVTPGSPGVEVTVTSTDSLNWCVLNVISDGNPPVEMEMNQVPGSGGTVWKTEIKSQFFRSLRFFVTMNQATVPWPGPVIWHPFYGLFAGEYRNEALPSAVRVREAPSTELLRPARSISLGPSLWALPMVNDSEGVMDLSLCHLSLGFPLSRVFLPDSVMLAPGETLFVTNDLEGFSLELPGRKAAGNSTSESVQGSTVTVFDPSWSETASSQVPLGVRNIRTTPGVPLVTEISYGQPLSIPTDDWIELYNPGGDWIDLSLAGISDSFNGHTVFPEGTMIPPFGFLVLASDPDLFSLYHPRIRCQVLGMGFSLSSDGETLRFVTRGGESITILSFQPWPDQDTGIIALADPGFDPSDPASWIAEDQPGTPGQPNPVWFQDEKGVVRILGLRPNPSRGGNVFFSLSPGVGPAYAVVTDLAGRVVMDRGVLQPGIGEYFIEPPPGLPSGMYFLVVNSSGGTSARKFLWLP